MRTITQLVILGSLLFQACENAPVRREEMYSENPKWNREMADLIKAGFLGKGMDQEQVKAAWGRPCWSCTGTTKGDWGEAWEYATQTVFFNKNGKVTRWEAN